ncbi:endonuclease domain-containing protein [Streptomyces sp. YIM S03343]
MQDLTRLTRDGVLLTAHALAAGWPARRLTRRLRRDGWLPIHPGAWSAPGVTVDWVLSARAIQILRPRFVCSHSTAAALHRIELLGKDPGSATLEFSVTVRASTDQPAGVRVRTATHLTGNDLTVRKGLVVTAPARTVADLLRAGPRDDAVVAADSALSPRRVAGVSRPALVTPASLEAELTPPHHGARQARRWLGLTDPAAGSPAETIARLRMHDAGLCPATQVELRAQAGRRVRPDFLFLAEGLVVEIEGYAFHGTREAHAQDARRFNELTTCVGVRRVLRFTAAEVFRRPDAMIAAIRAALADLAGAPGGPGLHGVGIPGRSYRGETGNWLS